jgi:hypothetical protein
MKSVISLVSLATFVVAEPWENSHIILNDSNLAPILKIFGTDSSKGCRACKNQFCINEIDSNQNITLTVTPDGKNLNYSFPNVPGKLYTAVHLNIDTELATTNNTSDFNCNQNCSLRDGGTWAECIVPLSVVVGNQCGGSSSDYCAESHVSFSSSSDGWCYGPCCCSNCNFWSDYGLLHFDCSLTVATRTDTVTAYLTTIKARTITIIAVYIYKSTKDDAATTTTGAVSSTATKKVTTMQPGSTKTTTVLETVSYGKITLTAIAPKTTTFTTVTTSAGTIMTVTSISVVISPYTFFTTRTDSTTLTQTVTFTASAPTVTTVSTLSTTETVSSAAIYTPSARPTATAFCNEGAAINIASGLTGLLFDTIFTCTAASLTQGTYGFLTVTNSQGALVNVGAVVLKLESDGLHAVVTADAGYDLVQVRVYANCALPLGLNTCSAFNICTAGSPGSSLNPTVLTEILSLPTCILGKIYLDVQGIVQQIVYPALPGGDPCLVV